MVGYVHHIFKAFMNTCFSVNNVNILVVNYFVGLCIQKRSLYFSFVLLSTDLVAQSLHSDIVLDSENKHHSQEKITQLTWSECELSD